MLNRSYPFNSSITVLLKLSFWIGLFIFLFLYTFQPFGLGSMPGNKMLIIAGYGVITFILSSLLSIINVTFFKEQHWTTLNQILFYLVLITLIALANSYYTKAVIPRSGWHPGTFMFYTLAVGFFPIVFITVIHERFLFKDHNLASDKVNTAIQSVSDQKIETSDALSFKSTNGNSVSISQSDILYVESQGNYQLIHHLENNSVAVAKYRGTNKAILSELNPMFRKTHRAFIVNTQYIQQATGNAQGITLSLNQGDMSVPVSRSYVKEFRAYLEG